MDKLRQTLVNAMEIKGIKRSDVAKQVGISGSRVTEFLNDEQEIAFDTVLYMVNILVPEKVKDLMVEYSMQVEKPKHIRYAMEYNSTHRNLETLEYLVIKARECDNVTLNKWSNLYDLIYRWQTLSFESNSSFYRELRNFNTTDDSLSALSMLLECNVLKSMKQNEAVESLTVSIEEKIDLIDSKREGFVQKSLKCRLFELVGLIELKTKCNFEHVKTCAEEILNCGIGYNYDGFAYYLLAMSEMHNDFSKSLFYLEEAIINYGKSNSFKNVNAMKGNVAVLHFVWGKKNRDNKHGHLYNLILSNDDRAIEEFKKEGKDFQESTLGLYLKGFILNDANVLAESFIKCFEENDKMMSLLPSNKLKSLDREVSSKVLKLLNIA